jgi:hypothetical protein
MTAISEFDKPCTLTEAADALGVPYHVIQRAARRGFVRTYHLGTSRPYVKLRDFFDLMERSNAATEGDPADASLASSNSAAANLSKDDASRSGGAK